MVTEVRRSNPAAFTTLMGRIKELEGLEEAVGWFESAHYEGGQSVAYIASIQEQGLHKRPFIRPTVMEKQKAWSETFARGAKAMLNGGESANSVLEKLGTMVEGDIAETITRITAPPLSPITILLRYWRRQGRKITGRTVGEAAAEIARPDYVKPAVSEKPLVDTGIMLDSLSHDTAKAGTYS